MQRFFSKAYSHHFPWVQTYNTHHNLNICSGRSLTNEALVLLFVASSSREEDRLRKVSQSKNSISCQTNLFAHPLVRRVMGCFMIVFPSDVAWNYFLFFTHKYFYIPFLYSCCFDPQSEMQRNRKITESFFQLLLKSLFSQFFPRALHPTPVQITSAIDSFLYPSRAPPHALVSLSIFMFRFWCYPISIFH